MIIMKIRLSNFFQEHLCFLEVYMLQCRFELRIRISISPGKLTLMPSVINVGDKAFSFTFAMRNCLSVSDIRFSSYRSPYNCVIMYSQLRLFIHCTNPVRYVLKALRRSIIWTICWVKRGSLNKQMLLPLTERFNFPNTVLCKPGLPCHWFPFCI